jgi:hypothetical protein
MVAMLRDGDRREKRGTMLKVPAPIAYRTDALRWRRSPSPSAVHGDRFILFDVVLLRRQPTSPQRAL